MIRGKLAALLAATAMSIATTAGAEVIGFEDFSFDPRDRSAATFIPAGYQGFDWGGPGGLTSWAVSPNTATFFFGGNRAYEGNNYAWGSGVVELELTAHGGGLFNIFDMAINKALGDASTITLRGYRGNSLAYIHVVGVDDDRATLAQYKKPKLNFYGIDRLNVYNNHGGGNMTIDNINASFGAVPEPASWALMIGGFGLAGGMLRRRRAVPSEMFP